jgi:alpha-L-fucosidase
MTAKDIRFNKKGDVLYVTAMGWPEDNNITIKALAKNSAHFKEDIAKIELLGSKEKINYKRDESGLSVTIPGQKVNDYGVVLKVTSRK